jgi:hypothetical protein
MPPQLFTTCVGRSAKSAPYVERASGPAARRSIGANSSDRHVYRQER